MNFNRNYFQKLPIGVYSNENKNGSTCMGVEVPSYDSQEHGCRLEGDEFKPIDLCQGMLVAQRIAVFVIMEEVWVRNAVPFIIITISNNKSHSLVNRSYAFLAMRSECCMGLQRQYLFTLL